MNTLIENFINLFNQEKFHEAHDFLEEFWRDYQGQDRKCYQALIQLTVALYLQQESRHTGAQKVLARALANIDSSANNTIKQINLKQLYIDTKEYLAGRGNLPRLDSKAQG